MKNILQLTRQSRGLTIEELALKSGLSRSSIIRAEQGLPSSIPFDLYHALDLNPGKANAAYTAFQMLTRAKNGAKAFPPNEPYINLSDYRRLSMLVSHRKDHPLRILLRGRSALSFCRAFCLPADVVSRWLREPHAINTVPEKIREVLDEVGYNKYRLDDAYWLYRMTVLNK